MGRMNDSYLAKRETPMTIHRRRLLVFPIMTTCAQDSRAQMISGHPSVEMALHEHTGVLLWRLHTLTLGEGKTTRWRLIIHTWNRPPCPASTRGSSHCHAPLLFCWFGEEGWRNLEQGRGHHHVCLLPGWAAEAPGKPVLGERPSRMTSIDEVLHLFWLHRSSQLQTSTIERGSAKSPRLPRQWERTKAGCSASHFLSLSPLL